MTAAQFSLLTGIVIASLIGSGHCVGMCGPFAILAAGPVDASRKASLLNLIRYHLGRGFTYLFLGAVAGVAGAALNFGGQLAGWQQAAAWITGGGMILFGSLALLRLSRWGNVHFNAPAFVGQAVKKMFRVAQRVPAFWRPLAVGGVTGFLPCGWLYAFLLLAVGTSSSLMGMAVMGAFWLGTIPSLSLVTLGLNQLRPSWKRWVPHFTAMLLVVSGMLTITFRTAADFSSLDQVQKETTNQEELLESIQTAPLPCCHSVPESDNSGKPACCQPK